VFFDKSARNIFRDFPHTFPRHFLIFAAFPKHAAVLSRFEIRKIFENKKISRFFARKKRN
jgi:hypothetical protein